MDPELEARLRLYPDRTIVTARGLELDGCVLADLAAEYGTPAYVLGEATLRANARRYRSAFADAGRPVTIAYASKALPARPVFEVLAEEGLWFDVASRGELYLALRSGVDPSRILVHGNAKDEAQVADALAAGVGLVVVDNEDELDLIERHAVRPQPVLLRINPGIETDTHPSIATGHSASKFGMTPDAFARAAVRAERSPLLQLRGVHAHIGSQIRSLTEFEQAVATLGALGEFEVYDVGGGLGVTLDASLTAPDVDAYAAAILAAADASLPPGAEVIVEPGRSIVARAGITLYDVVSVKRGEVVHVAVNGGMSDNLGTAVHAERRIADLVERPAGRDLIDLVGWHCESGDVLASGIVLDDPRAGDVLALPMTGAYTFSLASNYNAALRAPLVMVADGAARVAIRRETLDDLTAREVA